MKFSEVVNHVIELATVINDYWERELPKRHPRYPIVDPNVPDPPPQEEELRQFLRSLSAEEVFRLLALAYAGDRLSAKEFNQRLSDYAKGTVELHEAIDELAEMPGLNNYLVDGSQELATAGIALDPVGTPVVSSSS